MAMQLGSAGNMFATSDPSQDFFRFQQLNQQQQELGMRQQALQANLRSQSIADEGQQTMNEANRAKLDEFYSTADMRLESMRQSLLGEEADTAAKIQDTMYKPQLWRSQIAHTDASTDAIKANVDLAKQGFQLEKQKFSLAERAANQEFEANQINNAFRALQMPGMMQEQTQRIEAQAQALKTGAIQQHLLERQAAGFDMNQTLDRFRAYQQMAPELRKSAKRYMPEVYGDMPDYFEEDDIKSMQNAIGVLHYLKDDPTMALLGKSNPAVEQVKQAAMQLLQRNMDKASQRGKTDTSVTIDDAVTKMGKASKNAAKKQEESQTMQTLQQSNDNVDRLLYHQMQHKSDSNRPYLENVPSKYGAYTGESDFVSKSPLAAKIGAYATREGMSKEGWIRLGRGARYQNPNLSEQDADIFRYAIGKDAGVHGTNRQVAAFRSLVSELGDAVASGDKESGKDIIDSYQAKLGDDALTDKQKKVIQALSYKFGWKD